jgi:hypothetical protein
MHHEKKTNEQNPSSLFKSEDCLVARQTKHKERIFFSLSFRLIPNFFFAKLPTTTQTVDTSEGKTLKVSVPV